MSDARSKKAAGFKSLQKKHPSKDSRRSPDQVERRVSVRTLPPNLYTIQEECESARSQLDAPLGAVLDTPQLNTATRTKQADIPKTRAAAQRQLKVQKAKPTKDSGLAVFESSACLDLTQLSPSVSKVPAKSLQLRKVPETPAEPLKVPSISSTKKPRSAYLRKPASDKLQRLRPTSVSHGELTTSKPKHKVVAASASYVASSRVPTRCTTCVPTVVGFGTAVPPLPYHKPRAATSGSKKHPPKEKDNSQKKKKKDK